MELDEYLDIESRVSGRMVLLDVSATGEENVIEFQANNQVNDLEYRRAQLQKLQDTVIDLEDLSNGVLIADLTPNDFRIDLSGYLHENKEALDQLVLLVAATTENPSFSVVAPLLSRSLVVQLQSLTEDEVRELLHRAVALPARHKDPADRGHPFYHLCHAAQR